MCGYACINCGMCKGEKREMQLLRCIFCGHENEQEAARCDGCGKPLPRKPGGSQGDPA